MHDKTVFLIDAARKVLEESHPMTLRQLFYQLVSRQVIENTENRYKSLSDHIVNARLEGRIPWSWIEDRLRVPRTVSMWDDLPDFGQTVMSSYRRNVWKDQPTLVECWCEKDALSGIFQDILEEYGVTLNVGRGYDGWTSIWRAAGRYHDWKGSVVVLYFGDFDPSGEDMVRSLEERLTIFPCDPEVIKCALTQEDVERYNLPPQPTKKTDSRAKAFIAEFGDMAVELDALPVNVLRDRIKSEVESRMDMDALNQTKEREKTERDRLAEIFQNWER